LRTIPLLAALMVGQTATPASSTTAAVVNGQPLLAWEVERELALIVSTGSFHSRITPERLAELERRAVEALVTKEIKRQWVQRTGIDVDQREVDSALAETRARFPSPRAFAAALKEKGIAGEAAFRRAFVRDTAAEAADRHIRARVPEPKSEEIELYYVLHRDEYVRPEARHIVHVLFPVSPGASQERWEEAEERARLLANRVNEASGALLDAAATTISKISPQFRDQVGDLGFLHRGTLHPDLDREAFSTEVGRVTAPVRTIYGYHVVQVLEVRPPAPIEFDQVKRAIATNLSDQWSAEALAAFEHEIREQAEIEVHDWHD